MGSVLKLTIAALALAGTAACGNTTAADDAPSASRTPAADAPSSSAPATPDQKTLKTNFSGQVDLVARSRKADKDGNCHGIGPNADLKKGAKVLIRDAGGAVVTEAALKAGTLIPLGDDGPQACRLPFRTPMAQVAGRDFTAEIGGRKPVRFDVDDGMDIQVKVR